jgi:hypothetical protein
MPLAIIAGRGMESMRRWLVAVLLCILVASVLVIYVFWPSSKPAKANVGIFYYVWYGALESDWKPPKFVDYPVSDLGNYSSLNSTVIQRQLVLMKDLGVDFVVISWWGSGYNDTYGQFIDNATRKVFQVAEANMIGLKFAIMVEPYLGNGSSYDYVGVYNYIYAEFVAPYSAIYYDVDNRPLICFVNDPMYVPGLTPNGQVPNDSRFSTFIVGQQSYAQWVYTDLDHYDLPQRASYDNETSMTPRFDDSRFRSPSWPVDVNLSQGKYDQEWANAIQLWKEGKIHTIMITSWNEYVERTEIEPHYDLNYTESMYHNATYYLYNKTQGYINQVHN